MIFTQVTENLRPHKNLHVDIYSSFIHNHQNWEATKTPSNKWMDKLENPDNGLLLGD